MKEEIEQLIRDYKALLENYPSSNDYRRGIIDGATLILNDLISTITEDVKLDSEDVKLDPEVQEILDDIFKIRG